MDKAMADDKDKRIDQAPHVEKVTGKEMIPVSAEGQPGYVETQQIQGGFELKEARAYNGSDFNPRAAVQRNSGCTATGDYAVAMGNNTRAAGHWAVAEGYQTQALGEGSHAEGTGSISDAIYSHAEGERTTARGRGSHTEGSNTCTENNYEHASGYMNKSHKDSEGFGSGGNTLFSVGNGSYPGGGEHNAFEVMQNGDFYITDTSAEGGRHEKPMLNLQEELRKAKESGGWRRLGTKTLRITNHTKGTHFDLKLDDNEFVESIAGKLNTDESRKSSTIDLFYGFLLAESVQGIEHANSGQFNAGDIVLVGYNRQWEGIVSVAKQPGNYEKTYPILGHLADVSSYMSFWNATEDSDHVSLEVM